MRICLITFEHRLGLREVWPEPAFCTRFRRPPGGARLQLGWTERGGNPRRRRHGAPSPRGTEGTGAAALRRACFSGSAAQRSCWRATTARRPPWRPLALLTRPVKCSTDPARRLGPVDAAPMGTGLQERRAGHVAGRRLRGFAMRRSPPTRSPRPQGPDRRVPRKVLGLLVRPNRASVTAKSQSYARRW